MASEFHYRGPIPLPVVRIGLVTSFVFEYMCLVSGCGLESSKIVAYGSLLGSLECCKSVT
jgi:hypothetical protein